VIEVLTGQEGDDLEINIGKGNYKETYKTEITADVIRQDIGLEVTKNELLMRSIFPVELSFISWLILLTLPFALIFRIAYLHYKK